ncbi:30S ribosomal protein S8 [Candidatus Pacearchaeota archaeon]|nr:30S ribosomal protein S8 [Candidatus Pacearchaeota archaeon]
MSHDVVADGLNVIKNAKMAGKEIVKIKTISNLLIEVLKIMKQKEAIKKYKIDAKEKSVEVHIGNLYECKAIKPRFTIKRGQIDRYRRRYLPSRQIGTIVISTNKGLMTHDEAEEEQSGGCLIAYFY